MRSKIFFKNVVSYFIVQIILIVSGFLIPRMILDNYGSEVNGIVSSITQFLAYITLLEAGFGPVVKATLYKPIAKKNNEEIASILKSTESFFKKLAGIFLVYIAVLCVIFPLFIGEHFSSIYTISLVLIISISIFAEYYFGMTYTLFLQASQKSYIVSNIQGISTLLNAVIMVLLIKLGFGIHVVKIGSAIALVIRPLLQNYYVKKKYKINLKNSKKIKIKQQWEGLAQHIASVIHGNTDTVVLSVLRTLKEVSVYSVYSLVVMSIKNLMYSFRSGIDSIFGDMLAKKQKETLRESFLIYELFYYTIVSIIFTVTLVMIIPFVTIYTTGINDANYIQPTFAMLLVIAELFDCLRWPYSTIIIAGGHFRETRIGAWVEAGTNILVSIILVSRYGLIGVAIGTLVAMVIRTLEFVYFVSRKVLNRSVFIFVKRFVIISFQISTSLLASNYLLKLIYINNFVMWIVGAIISFAVSSIIVIITNMILYRKDFLSIYNTIIKRRKNNE